MPPAGAFMQGSLARALAGSPQCRMPCWLGIRPMVTTDTELQQWLVDIGLSGKAERTEYDTGTTVLIHSVNPTGVFPRNARLVTLLLDQGNLDTIAVDGIPVARPIRAELDDLIILLGLPDHITLDWTPGDSVVTYGLSFIWLSRELAVNYSEIAKDVTIDGNLTTAVCLPEDATGSLSIRITPALRHTSYNDYHNLAEMRGLTEEELLVQLLAPASCIPF